MLEDILTDVVLIDKCFIGYHNIVRLMQYLTLSILNIMCCDIYFYLKPLKLKSL